MTAHRSAKGKVVDMGTLSAMNEKTRAVGNMGVNARGDVLDAHNKVVRENTTRVSEGYNSVVVSGRKDTHVREVIQADDLTEAEKEFENDDEDFEK